MTGWLYGILTRSDSTFYMPFAIEEIIRNILASITLFGQAISVFLPFHSSSLSLILPLFPLSHYSNLLLCRWWPIEARAVSLKRLSYSGTLLLRIRPAGHAHNLWQTIQSKYPYLVTLELNYTVKQTQKKKKKEKSSEFNSTNELRNANN